MTPEEDRYLASQRRRAEADLVICEREEVGSYNADGSHAAVDPIKLGRQKRDALFRAKIFGGRD